jgi:uncharacterized protein (DUF1697 family)
MSGRRVIALFRAVNVGGRILKMADLTSVLLDLGFDEPRTLMQSGNAVFGVGKSGRASLATLEKKIEQAIQEECRIQSDVFLRSADEWDEMIAANPFEEARTDPGHMILTTLRDAPGPSAVSSLAASIKGPERVHAHGRVLYVVYPDGMGRSKLTHMMIEKALGTRGTARNWNTVMKLRTLASA